MHAQEFTICETHSAGILRWLGQKLWRPNVIYCRNYGIIHSFATFFDIEIVLLETTVSIPSALLQIGNKRQGIKRRSMLKHSDLTAISIHIAVYNLYTIYSSSYACIEHKKTTGSDKLTKKAHLSLFVSAFCCCCCLLLFPPTPLSYLFSTYLCIWAS